VTHLHIDFETRSTVDIKRTGAYVYAEDPTTDLWCACYAFDDGPIETWRPGQPCPDDIFDHVLAGGVVYAHNAAFERVIWKHILAPRYGWPEPLTRQWRCTMTMAYAMALPGALEDAAPAAGIEHRKDAAGHRLMLQMSRPRKIKDQNYLAEAVRGYFLRFGRNGPLQDANSVAKREWCRRNAESVLVWWDDPTKVERLIAYCRQDVEVERQLAKRLRPLKESELALWHLDQVVNDRGVHVDQALCHAAKAVVATTAERLDEEMRRVTDGAVTACSNVGQLIGFVRGFGVDTESIAKDVIEELLAKDLPAPVRRALELRREAAKASVAKIDALLKGTSPDGRARGLLQFHAASTGRWAGRRFQPQNIKRPSVEDVTDIIDTVLTGDADLVEALFDEPLTAVADCLRGMVAAPAGKKIVAADYAAIEGRVLAWLAGEQWKLDAYRAFDRGEGPDLYKVAYARSFSLDPKDVTKPQRQVGKVMELALGYQGGVGAFQTMAVNYGVKLPDAEVERIRDGWRASNPAIKQFWWGLERAAIGAVESPGTVTAVRDIRFKVAGSFLFMRLPSGRFLAYAYPEIQPKLMPWRNDDGSEVWKDSLSYMGVNSYTRKWERCFAYGGLLAENATQAVARDVLAESLPRLEAAGYPVILTVHDEVVCEVDEAFGSPSEMIALMTVIPPWLEGCPVVAEGFEARRYRK
jgi:DNA polymerase